MIFQWLRARLPQRLTRRDYVWVSVLALFLALSGGVAIAASSSSGHGATIDCPAGDGLLAKPAGDHVSGECITLPTPAPTTTTPSPTPTVTSPSPTPPPVTTTTAPPSPTPTTTSPTPSPSPTTTPPNPGACPVAGKNVPGAADPWGGCFPGPGNTGVPAGTALTDYAGPCNITTANLVLDAKHITCSVLSISAANVSITRSYLDGTAVRNNGGSFQIADSKVRGGVRDDECCVSDRNYTVLRVEFVGSYRGALCQSSCLIQDSWVHGAALMLPAQHGSALREGVSTKAIHNSLVCDWPTPNDTTTLGCSGDLVGYPNQLGLTTIHDNTISRNLFLSSAGVLTPGNVPVVGMSYCLYAGGAGSTNQKVTENVFTKGKYGQCADYGPVTGFNSGGSGNVWSGNVWDSGGSVPPDF